MRQNVAKSGKMCPKRVENEKIKVTEDAEEVAMRDKYDNIGLNLE